MLEILLEQVLLLDNTTSAHKAFNKSSCVLHSWLAQLNKTGGGPCQTVLSQSKVRFETH